MVEDVLVLDVKVERYENGENVLILVVVEDVLVRHSWVRVISPLMSLNPCCGGRCSSTL